MKKELAKLAGLGGQLEKLRGAIEDARRGRQPQARGAVHTQLLGPIAVQPPGFVEFSGAQLMDVPVATVIEMVDANGVRLTIRLAAGQPLDVAAVVSHFRGTPR